MRVLEGEGCSGAWRRARRVRIGSGIEAARVHEVDGVRGGGKYAILALTGIADRDAAEGFRGLDVFVERAVLPELEEGLYYAADLLGLEVVDTSGRSLGRLREVFDNGAHEVYVVGDARREVLLPVIEGVVLEVDPEAGRIVVDPPAGLPGLEG